MKKYTTHNTLLLCLFFVSLLFAACKDKGNEEVKQQDNKTVVEGTWTISSSTTDSLTLTFTGANFTMHETEQGPITSPSEYTGTDNSTLDLSGTFRLDNNQIWIKPTAATLTTVLTITADSGNPPTYTSFPATETHQFTGTQAGTMLNQEFSLGAYAVNGNTLRISDPSDASQYQDLNKQ
ncbi:MAG: hypothetical protein J6Y75_08835 [Spirochaetaceae bacterium]|nr:hypothetical protein [Spirochaetaceae bacterium]